MVQWLAKGQQRKWVYGWDLNPGCPFKSLFPNSAFTSLLFKEYFLILEGLVTNKSVIITTWWLLLSNNFSQCCRTLIVTILSTWLHLNIDSLFKLNCLLPWLNPVIYSMAKVLQFLIKKHFFWVTGFTLHYSFKILVCIKFTLSCAVLCDPLNSL